MTQLPHLAPTIPWRSAAARAIGLCVVWLVLSGGADAELLPGVVATVARRALDPALPLDPGFVSYAPETAPGPARHHQCRIDDARHRDRRRQQEQDGDAAGAEELDRHDAVGRRRSAQHRAAIVGFVAFGLLLTLAWVRLAAPDVALTEAAIGSGLG